ARRGARRQRGNAGRRRRSSREGGHVTGSNLEDGAMRGLRGSNDEVRALRVMVEELRAEVPPELPWGALEQRLLAEIARREERERSHAASGLRRAFAFAAVAAAVLLGGLSAGKGELSLTSVEPSAAVDVAALALAPGEAG